MAANGKFEFDDDLDDDVDDILDDELDENFLNLVKRSDLPKKQTKKQKPRKFRRPEPWDDDWIDPADDLASD